jgi:hypothetical protein
MTRRDNARQFQLVAVDLAPRGHARLRTTLGDHVIAYALPERK